MNTIVTAAAAQLHYRHRLSVLKPPAVAAATSAVSYEQYAKEREQILMHKWLLSEQAGYDIGFDSALVDWIAHFREKWTHAQSPVAARSDQNDQRQRETARGVVRELVAA